MFYCQNNWSVWTIHFHPVLRFLLRPLFQWPGAELSDPIRNSLQFAYLMTIHSVQCIEDRSLGLFATNKTIETLLVRWSGMSRCAELNHVPVRYPFRSRWTLFDDDITTTIVKLPINSTLWSVHFISFPTNRKDCPRPPPKLTTWTNHEMALRYREWQRVRVLPIDKFNFISFIVNYFDQFTTTCQFIHPRQLFSTLLTIKFKCSRCGWCTDTKPFALINCRPRSFQLKWETIFYH